MSSRSLVERCFRCDRRRIVLVGLVVLANTSNSILHTTTTADNRSKTSSHCLCDSPQSFNCLCRGILPADVAAQSSSATTSTNNDSHLSSFFAWTTFVSDATRSGNRHFSTPFDNTNFPPRNQKRLEYPPGAKSIRFCSQSSKKTTNPKIQNEIPIRFHETVGRGQVSRSTLQWLPSGKLCGAKFVEADSDVATFEWPLQRYYCANVSPSCSHSGSAQLLITNIDWMGRKTKRFTMACALIVSTNVLQYNIYRTYIILRFSKPIFIYTKLQS